VNDDELGARVGKIMKRLYHDPPMSEPPASPIGRTRLRGLPIAATVAVVAATAVTIAVVSTANGGQNAPDRPGGLTTAATATPTLTAAALPAVRDDLISDLQRAQLNVSPLANGVSAAIDAQAALDTAVANAPWGNPTPDGISLVTAVSPTPSVSEVVCWLISFDTAKTKITLPVGLVPLRTNAGSPSPAFSPMTHPAPSEIFAAILVDAKSDQVLRMISGPTGGG